MKNDQLPQLLNAACMYAAGERMEMNHPALRDDDSFNRVMRDQRNVLMQAAREYFDAACGSPSVIASNPLAPSAAPKAHAITLRDCLNEINRALNFWYPGKDASAGEKEARHVRLFGFRNQLESQLKHTNQ